MRARAVRQGEALYQAAGHGEQHRLRGDLLSEVGRLRDVCIKFTLYIFIFITPTTSTTNTDPTNSREEIQEYTNTAHTCKDKDHFDKIYTTKHGHRWVPA